MASTGNVVAGISHIPRVLTQKLKEELGLYAFNTPSISTVTAAGTDKLDQCDVILQELQAREQEIQADALLSDEGKRQKMQVTAKEFYSKLRFIAEAVENRRQAALELRKELDKLPPSAGDPIVEYMRGAEIRAQLRILAEPERMKLLAQSVERKNLSILRAIEADPVNPNTLVPAEYRERIKEQLIQQDHKSEHVRWQALLFVGEKLQLLANVIEGILGQYRLDVPVFPAKTDARPVDLKGVNTQAAPPKSKAADKAPANSSQFV